MAKKTYTNEEIAADYNLWIEFVDPTGVMTKEEWEALSMDERMEIIEPMEKMTTITEKEIEAMIYGAPSITSQCDPEGAKRRKEYNISIVQRWIECGVNPSKIKDDWLRSKVERYMERYQ
jgi:hypothetical protein